MGSDSILSMSSDAENSKFRDYESHSLRRLYPLLDALDSHWPKFFVFVGLVVEMIQMYGMLFNHAFTWGPIVQVFSVAIEATLLPFWDNDFVASLSFSTNAVLLVLLFVACVFLWLIIWVEFSRIDVRSQLQFPRLTKLLLYTLIGPFFLPSLHLILSLSVCTGGNVGTENTLVDFTEERCLDPEYPWMITIFAASMVTLPLLLIPKIVITMLVYDDSSISDSVRARPHCIVEGWVLVHTLLFSALFHYLTGVGQREAFSGIYCVGCFLMVVLHVFYLPFYSDFVNRIRVVGYSVLSFASLVMTLGLIVGPSSPIYGDTSMDLAILLPGGLVVAILAYAFTLFRVSNHHRRDIARARHGEIRPEKFVRRMFFPWYLPQVELQRLYANRYVLDARYNVTVPDADLGMSSASGGVRSSINTAGTSTLLNSSILRNLHREVEEMAKFEMTSYIDSVYTVTDVELATRFLISFTRVTNTTIPDHLLEYGMSIYNKGLNRFVRDSWLQLQFAVFLCCYVSRTNHVSLALCEDLSHRELGPLLSYRLHRCSSSISDQRIRRNQAARQHLQHAKKIHKETLMNMQIFWRRMLSERIDVTILGEASMTIISGCNRGIRYYKAAIAQKTDSMILSCFAQFLEDVVLSPEAAEYTREIAADMAVKHEQGISVEDLTNDRIISSKQKLGSRYGRISRNLRFVLILVGIVMFGLLVAMFAIIISTYVKSSRVLSSLYTAASFRFYAFRCMWLAQEASNSTQSDVLWNYLEDDLTKLRGFYQDLTYGRYKAVSGEEVSTLQGSFFSIIYGNTAYLLEDTGVWRAGEILIDALETLVLYRSGDFSRVTAQNFIDTNALQGASGAFNSSLSGYQNQGNKDFEMAIYIIVALYVAMLAILFITFFMFRYYLKRITGIGVMALSLFRLIPKNSLEFMVSSLDSKIENFDEPDAELQRMILERKSTNYLGAELEIHHEASESSTMSEIPTLQLKPVNATGPVQGGSGVKVSFNPLAQKMADENSGNRFDSMVRNSSIADVGRIKIHQGQYEVPYKIGNFPPRELSEEEKRSRQEEINDIEVETSLSAIRQLKESNKNGGSEQLDEGSTYFAPVTIDGSNDVFNRKFTVILAFFVAVLSVIVGIYNLTIVSTLQRNHDTSIPLIHQMNIFEQQMYYYFAALEAFTLLSTMMNGAVFSAENYAEVQTALTDLQNHASYYAVANVAFFQHSSEVRLSAFTIAMEKYHYYSTVVIHQLLAASRIGCSVVSAPSGAEIIDCSFFQYYDYEAKLFLPNLTQNVIFDRSVQLPTNWETDSALTVQERATIAINVIASPYYVFLFNSTAEAWKKVRKALTNELNDEFMAAEIKRTKNAKNVMFTLTIALALLLVGLSYQTGRYSRDSMVFIFCLICTTLGCGVLALQTYFFLSTLPMDGPNNNCLQVLGYTSGIFTLQMSSFENMKQGAFANVWLGAVNFATVTGPQLFASWNSLFELLGFAYLEDLTKSYDNLQYCFYLTTIILRLAINYQGYPAEFAKLRIISTVEWDLTKETLGRRTELTYKGTFQQLYSDKTTDLALSTEDQKYLCFSLAFGPLHQTNFNSGIDYMNTAVNKYVTDQMNVAEKRYNMQYPLMIASAVMVLCITFVTVLIIFFLVIYLIEMYHSRKRIRSGDAAARQAYDRGFGKIIRWSTFLNVLFFIFLTLVAAFVLQNYLSLLHTFRRINILNLREVKLIESEIAMSKAITKPWFRSVSKYFAEAAVSSSDEYYRTTLLNFFSNLPPLLFGGVDNVSYVRYNKEFALDQSKQKFESQSPVIAFYNYVDPSIRNWRQRVIEMITMTTTNRFSQNEFLRMSLFNLTTLSFASTTAAHNDLQSSRLKWLIIHLVFAGVTMITFLIALWYMAFPVVSRLRQEEEGTQVVLQMIPPQIRSAIPAIHQYMKTGGLSQDTNALEINQISKDLSVVPIITINTEGKIRQFSRAAEESFLWTRSEAVGQNVKILMPDNVAEEHDRYLQMYLKTGVKTMIGNSTPIRAKRKDGTLFSAIIEVSEFHTGSELCFVGAVHVSQEVMELERSAELSQALTDASSIPIVVCNSDGIIQSFSKSAEEVFKYKQDVIVGQKVNMLMPRSDAEMHDTYLERYMRTGHANILGKARLLRAKRQNGEIFPIRLLVREFKLSGRVLFVGYIEDLTARLRLEMIAAAGDLMQEKSPVPLLVTDMAGRVVQCSHSIQGVCGMTPSEVMNRDIRYLIRGDSVMDLVEQVKNNPRGIQAHIDDFQTVECTVMRRTEDGTDGTFQARVTTRLFTWHTKGPHLMIFLEDLTNLQQLDLHCHIGDAVMALSAVPIVVVTDTGHVVQMSSAAETTFRCLSSDIYDRSVDILFESDDSENPRARRSPGEEDGGNSNGSAEGRLSKNPIARVVEEYRKTGSTTLCGRLLKGVAKTTDYGSPFSVEVLVKDVDQGDEKLFLAYIRNTEEDHQLLEVTRWNDAFMALTPIPVVCSNLDGLIFACSDSACTRFGWPREELIGSNVSVLMPSRYGSEHGKYMQQFKDTLEAAYKDGERKSILNRSALFVGRAQDGEEFPVTVSLRDVHIEGADSFIVAALRPSQQDMELEALGKIGATMSTLSPCPFICINAYGIVTEFSRSSQEAFGYAEHEVVGQNISMLQTPDVAAHHDGYLRAYQKTGVKRMIDRTVPVVVRKKDGTLMNIELSVKEVRHNNVLEFIGYIRDVTGKQTTKQMVALDDLVELEAASPMLELDTKGNILEVRCLERDLGYTKSELLGKSVLTVLPHNYTNREEETWIQTCIRDLMNGTQKKESMPSMSLNNSHAPEMPWISRRLFARQKSGEEFWCEAIMGEVTYSAVDPIAAAGGGKHRSQRSKAKEDARIVMYLRNLQQEVLLELAHGINSTAVELLSCPLVTLDIEGTITLYNRAAEEAFAYTMTETVGKPLISFVVAHHAERVRNALNVLRSPGSIAFTETSLEDLQIRRKGGSAPVSMTLTLQRLTDLHNVPYLLGAFRDPMADSAGVAEETLSNVLMAFSPVPIVVTDDRGVIEQFSSGAESFLGYTQLDVEGKDVGILRARLASFDRGVKNDHSAEDFFRTSMTYTQGMQLPVSIRERIIVTSKEGKQVYASVHIHSIMPFKMKRPRFIAYMQDTTEDSALQVPLQRYNSLFNTSLSGVIVLAAHGVVYEANPTAENVLGYTKAELAEMPVNNLIAGDSRQSSKLLRAASHVMESTAHNHNQNISAVQVRDAELICKGGERVAVDAVVATVLPSKGEEAVRVAINFIDVASEKKTRMCQQREEFLESISGVISIELDPNGNFLRVSASFLNILEYDAQEVIGHSWVSLVPKGDRQLGNSLAMAINVCQQGMEMPVEHVNLTFVAKSGVSVKMDGEMKGSVRANGSLCSLLGSLQVVQLRDTQLAQLAMTAMDVSDAGLILCTVDGAIISTNSTAHKIFEIPSDTTVIGQRMTIFFSTENQKESLERFQRLVLEGQTEIVKGMTYPQYSETQTALQRTTFALEIKVLPIKSDEGTNNLDESTGRSQRGSMRNSRRGSMMSQALFNANQKDRRSSLLLVRMRRVNEKHQLLLMRSAMETALAIGPFATFSIDDTGVITTWGLSAHRLFNLPTPIGRNVLEVLFDGASAATLRQLLAQFRKHRLLGDLERQQCTAFVYKTDSDHLPPAGVLRSRSPASPNNNFGKELQSATGAAVNLTALSPPTGSVPVEVLFKEAKTETGAIVNSDLLCYVRNLGRAGASPIFA